MFLYSDFPLFQERAFTLLGANQYLPETPTDYLFWTINQESGEAKGTWAYIVINNPRYTKLRFWVDQINLDGHLDLSEGQYLYQIYGMTNRAIATPASPFNVGVANEGVLSLIKGTNPDYTMPSISIPDNIIYYG